MVFDGVLNPGENVTVNGHYVKLVKIWASNSSGKVVSGAVFEIDGGESYSLESGESKVIQPFVVNLKSATIVGGSWVKGAVTTAMGTRRSR
ncbi:hypothetical protein [Thermococcus peptonophilus]|uniref:hypothetical protein n=1 Tax=Thermococcus peptonophilus TaxID=53952 RepID=UPI0006D0B860